MKKLTFLTALICGLLAVQTAVAQNPATTLQHAGATQVFYSNTSFSDAYTAAVNGDTLLLSTGYFVAPASLAKDITVIGAGHFPDSANVTKRTYILTGLTINAGADSLHLEGLYINGDINYAAASSINYVKVFRCRLSNALFNSSSTTASKNNCSYEECFVFGSIDFSNYGNNFLVKNSIIQGRISNIIGGALIENNILFSDYAFYMVCSSMIQNNIIFPTYALILYTTTGNNFNNNLLGLSSPDFGTNSVSNNYTGITQATVFVNQTGAAVDYTHDYHLKNPTTYLGTDGTQVGIYGGTAPFKDKGLPSNPQVIKKVVANQANSTGQLPISFKVKAQDY